MNEAQLQMHLNFFRMRTLKGQLSLWLEHIDGPYEPGVGISPFRVTQK